MKKISKWYWIGSALLLIWAARDFYMYMTMGRELLAEYPEVYSVREMIKGDLIRAGVKAGAALLLPAAGFFLSRQSSRKPRKALTAVTGLLLLSVMGTWLISMGCLTLVTAQEIYDGMYDAAENFPEAVDRQERISRFYDPDYSSYRYHHTHPDYLENRMLSAIARQNTGVFHTAGRYSAYDHSTGEERNKLIRNIHCPMETAVLFYDKNGSLLHSSDEDIMYFGYYTREEWDAGQDSAAPRHYGWMDISGGKEEGYPNDPWLQFRTTYNGTHSLSDIPSLRVTGYFEGTRLVPATVHVITDGMICSAVEGDKRFQTGPDQYTWKNSDVDRTGKLDWQLLLDRSAEYADKELVTVYPDHPEMWDYSPASSPYVYTNGVEYENLAELVRRLDFPARMNNGSYSQNLHTEGSFQLNDLLVFGIKTYEDYDRSVSDPGKEPETELLLITAVHGNPLKCAVSALRNIYILTGLLALFLLLIARWVIRTHLVQPVRNIADAMEDDWRNQDKPDNLPAPSAMWAEIQKLNTEFESEKDSRRTRNNEITRLNTALTYARAAEENRRQMTSGIAHELKTPLAVIHSYAEGLKEQIAPEKQEKYLDMILSEAERTDAMVLELLDLSRLEAGKVKLSRDEFSLTELTKAILEKLALPAQSRGLRVALDFPDECIVTADESRIAQVIENFAGNAVKYTTEGGSISVRISRFRGKTTFAISNDCEPLSAEALDRVWDSFYRADEARSGNGTGLGLAIAKSIIELHGGTCGVRSIPTGVEFMFTI